MVGLSLAYFGFRHGLPLTIRSAFYPLIGERIHGPIGHAVDIFAVLGTMFGVATSLGLGVLQINAGLNHLIGCAEGPGRPGDADRGDHRAGHRLGRARASMPASAGSA